MSKEKSLLGGLFGKTSKSGGSKDQAEHIKSYGGFKLGIGGVLTYKKSDLTEVLAEVELDSIILETDSPYLSPTPYRGKRNESCDVVGS